MQMTLVGKLYASILLLGNEYRLRKHRSMSYGVLDPLIHFQDNTCLPVTIYEKQVINGKWKVAEYLSFRAWQEIVR